MKSNDDISGLVRPNILTMQPYSTARDDFKGGLGVFLDANESPYDTGFNRYPDPHQKTLKEKLSEIKGLPVENIFVGNGSDEAIDLIFRVFCVPGVDNAVIISPSYGMYAVCAQINDIEVHSVPLGEDFSFPEKGIEEAIDERTKVIFLCSPNNPSGNAFSQEEMLGLVQSFHGLVVVDEAYADFSLKGSIRSKVLKYPNLVILQTLSKAWGMAGLRLGLAFAQEYIIRLMSEVKYPYNINKAAQQMALKALDEPVGPSVKAIIVQRDQVAGRLGNFRCVTKVYPSDANFLLVKVDDADRLYSHLIKDGIIVRNRTKLQGCRNCLRITIGLPSENDNLIASISEYEKGNIHR